MRVLLVLLALGSGAARAQNFDCSARQSQIEINACTAQAWQDADQVLNALWKQAKTAAQGLDVGQPPDQAGVWQSLLDGQRAWIVYRDRSCEAAGGPMRGGSGEAMLVNTCRTDLTLQRNATLQDFIAAAQR